MTIYLLFILTVSVVLGVTRLLLLVLTTNTAVNKRLAFTAMWWWLAIAAWTAYLLTSV